MEKATVHCEYIFSSCDSIMAPDYAEVDMVAAKSLLDRAKRVAETDEQMTSITYHGVNIPHELIDYTGDVYDPLEFNVRLDSIIVNIHTETVWIRYTEKHTNAFFEIRVGFE